MTDSERKIDLYVFQSTGIFTSEEVSVNCDLGRSTVSKVLSDMEKHGIIIRITNYTSGMNKKKRYYRYNKEADTKKWKAFNIKEEKIRKAKQNQKFITEVYGTIDNQLFKGV
jgi:predicted transcriptional regulator